MAGFLCSVLVLKLVSNRLLSFLVISVPFSTTVFCFAFKEFLNILAVGSFVFVNFALFDGTFLIIVCHYYYYYYWSSAIVVIVIVIIIFGFHVYFRCQPFFLPAFARMIYSLGSLLLTLLLSVLLLFKFALLSVLLSVFVPFACV